MISILLHKDIQVHADQFEEEIIKAILIENLENGIEWKALIKEVEEHPYFLGQIRFLMEWCKEGESYNLENFIVYKNTIIQIFDSINY